MVFQYASSRGSAMPKQGPSTTSEVSGARSDSTDVPSVLTRTAASSPDSSYQVESSSPARPRLPHSASTPSVGLGSHRSSSPMAFGYPYHQSAQGGLMTESQTPTVIKGWPESLYMIGCKSRYLVSLLTLRTGLSTALLACRRSPLAAETRDVRCLNGFLPLMSYVRRFLYCHLYWQTNG